MPTNTTDDLTRVITEAIRQHVLGPQHHKAATAYPLFAVGGVNEPDHWRGTDNTHGKRRSGSPCITVHTGSVRKWVATVLTSPTGKNLTVYVPKGTTVVEVAKQ